MLFLECSLLGVVIFNGSCFLCGFRMQKREKHFANEFDIIHSNGDVALHFLSPINWEWNIFMLLDGGGAAAAAATVQRWMRHRRRRRRRDRGAFH